MLDESPPVSTANFAPLEQAPSIANCISVLKSLLENPEKLAELSHEDRVGLLAAAGRISRPSKDEIRVRNKAIGRVRRRHVVLADRRARSNTGIREARTNAVFVAPLQISDASFQPSAEQILKSARNCYVCKAEFTQLHFFYDSMCPTCADFNYTKRFQLARLDGRVALITGSRLKIGYHCTLMMLRAGARVIATTRFPIDSALRFSKENDFESWRDRLEIYGLDLRHTPSVELFTRHMEQKLDRLDILINNAAQTVRRPPGFYAHMMENENRSWSDLPEAARTLLQAHEDCKAQLAAFDGTNTADGETAKDTAGLAVTWHGHSPGIGLRASAQLSQIPYSYDRSISPAEVFPEGKLDADLQQVDLRTVNSWRLKLADVPTPEMLEVQLVNSVAPFVLCSRLAPIMRRDYTGEKHMVNVTAMEGKFYRFTKSDRHPHTNMAKAALNMMTHTSASDLAKDGIYMNAVDTGWVTDEDPAQLAQMKQDVHDFQPPLDIVDGAARVCDPFFDGILTGKHWSGKFLKDYFPTDW
jgi:NAD(P)-dependent dehydrogenase (short-subunit alcohol dehydrogenase family)